MRMLSAILYSISQQNESLQASMGQCVGMFTLTAWELGSLAVHIILFIVVHVYFFTFHFVPTKFFATASLNLVS